MIGPLIYERSKKTEFKNDPDLILDSADLSPDLISSAIGTFFKAKYEDPVLLDQLCTSILNKYKANLNFVNGLFLKFLIERCIQLGYKNQIFYIEMDNDVIKRKISIINATIQDISKGRQNEFTIEKVEALRKEEETLKLTQQYCRLFYDDQFLPTLMIYQNE